MERTRRTIEIWSQRQSASLLALRWEGRTGTYAKLTDVDDPALRSEVMALLQADTFEALDRAMVAILRRVP